MHQQELDGMPVRGPQGFACGVTWDVRGWPTIVVSVRLWGAAEWVVKRLDRQPPMTDDELATAIDALTAAAWRDAAAPYRG